MRDTSAFRSRCWQRGQNEKLRPHAFIGQLINSQYIDPNPMHVEANSVNAFRPAHGSDITAFGFRVYAVIGYEQDDGLFKGPGQALTGPLYGAVLSAPSEAVESRLREAGSNATVRTVIPLLLTARWSAAHLDARRRIRHGARLFACYATSAPTSGWKPGGAGP